MIYTLTLNPALDYYMYTDNLKFSDINRSLSEQFSYGGKGINVSVMLSRLGVESIALGFVGGFSGDILKSLLEKENVKTQFIDLIGRQTRINVKLRSSAELDVNASGPVCNLDDINKLYTCLESLKAGDILVLAGSLPKGAQKDIYSNIAKILKEKNVQIVVDAEGETLENCLKYHPLLIKPNHHELGNLFNTQADDTQTVISLGKKLKEMGAQNVLVSRAEKGAILLSDDGNIYVSDGIKGKLINSTGCGDSMIAGFLAAYTSPLDYEKCLTYAIAAGSATAFSDKLGEKEQFDRCLELIK